MSSCSNSRTLIATPKYLNTNLVHIWLLPLQRTCNSSLIEPQKVTNPKYLQHHIVPKMKKMQNISEMCSVSLTLALLLGANSETILLYNGQLCYQLFGDNGPFNVHSRSEGTQIHMTWQIRGVHIIKLIIYRTIASLFFQKFFNMTSLDSLHN
jgi:hypothetical protein